MRPEHRRHLAREKVEGGGEEEHEVKYITTPALAPAGTTILKTRGAVRFRRVAFLQVKFDRDGA
jgi:hypothetical protein|eukprot:COSAG06_NODE_25545_length_634_cov_0.938318_1_plen_64_part_00